MLSIGYMNVYAQDGTAVIRAHPAMFRDGGHFIVLMNARLKYGLTNPGYAIFQTKDLALNAKRGEDTSCVKRRRQ